MDALALVLPGTQALVSSILAEGWTQARNALARKWSKKGAISQSAAEHQLERGHELARHLGGDGDGSEPSRELLEAYWAGYLAGLGAGHAELLDAIRELGAAPTPAPRGSRVHNSNTGKVGTLLQTGDVNGDISFGR